MEAINQAQSEGVPKVTELTVTKNEKVSVLIIKPCLSIVQILFLGLKSLERQVRHWENHSREHALQTKACLVGHRSYQKSHPQNMEEASFKV